MREASVGRPGSRMRVAVRLLPAALVVIAVVIFVNNLHQQLARERDVTAAYALVADHPEISRRLPCFRGCGQAEGHMSVDSCFVRRRDEAGAVFQQSAHAPT